MKKCFECPNVADGPAHAQTENYPICEKCLSKGWEVVSSSSFLNDPELRDKIQIKSPLQPPGK